MIILHERLKELRKQQNLTQKNVADHLGIKLRTYQYYEGADNKAHRPDLETLVVLADLFRVSVDYLIGRSDQR